MKIAIVGAAYTGMAAARYFRSQGHEVRVSTTRADRVAELASVANQVVVTKGSDVAGMEKLIAGADAVVLTMAGGLGVKDGKPYMDPVAYRDSYVGTADGLIGALAGGAKPPGNRLLQFAERLWRCPRGVARGRGHAAQCRLTRCPGLHRDGTEAGGTRH